MSHREIEESGAREQDKQVSQQRSEEFRRAAVEKFHSRGSRTAGEVARVLGVSSWSLYQWARRYGNDDGMKRNRRPGDRSVQEKLKAVMEFEGLEGEKQGGCETGLGKLSTGDELVGLTRAFIYAGTPSVVASLWNVEDSSTAQLMASFYKNIKTMSKVDALRQAQLNLIRGNINSDLLARRGIGGVGKLGETSSAQLPAPSSELHAPSSVTTSHPYFWAPFILVGEGK